MHDATVTRVDVAGFRWNTCLHRHNTYFLIWKLSGWHEQTWLNNYELNGTWWSRGKTSTKYIDDTESILNFETTSPPLDLQCLMPNSPCFPKHEISLCEQNSNKWVGCCLGFRGSELHCETLWNACLSSVGLMDSIISTTDNDHWRQQRQHLLEAFMPLSPHPYLLHQSVTCAKCQALASWPFRFCIANRSTFKSSKHS